MTNALGILSGGSVLQVRDKLFRDHMVVWKHIRISEAWRNDSRLMIFLATILGPEGWFVWEKKQCTFPGMGESWAEPQGTKRENQMFWDYIQATREKLDRCWVGNSGQKKSYLTMSCKRRNSMPLAMPLAMFLCHPFKELQDKCYSSSF